jgi:hypothetical protein
MDVYYADQHARQTAGPRAVTFGILGHFHLENGQDANLLFLAPWVERPLFTLLINMLANHILIAFQSHFRFRFVSDSFHRG